MATQIADGAANLGVTATADEAPVPSTFHRAGECIAAEVSALKEQWFHNSSEKLLSVAATKSRGGLKRVLVSMEVKAQSLQESIALLLPKRRAQETAERLQLVLKSTPLGVAHLHPPLQHGG